ncbi:MAG: DUF2190 family protein [Candidatus Sumerlaeia bacterium]|nr:DUF2190 family protein [Candidatus Sumerlaeia bacterium]
MSHYILDKAYAVTDTGGVPAYRVVVCGTNAGECALPGAANAAKILGVTVHGQSLKGQNVAVRKAGIARVTAAGAIALGAPVNIAGTTGKIKAISETSGTKINCLGFAETAASADGDIIEVFLALHERTAP